MIHATAIVHGAARIDASSSIGPYAIIDEGVEIGPDCIIGPNVHITGLTRIGRGNRVYTGAVLGEAPQDLKYKGAPTGLRIGDENVFREHVTVHRSTSQDTETVVGSHNFLMAGCHVGHNCTIGNHVIIANGALLGGYVVVYDRAFISGNCLVHQFVRVGTLALMQGGSRVSKDLPPFTVARGPNTISGLNIVGLRRAGYGPSDRLELRQLYHLLFRSGAVFRAAMKTARARFHAPCSAVMLDFCADSKRGICADTGSQVGEDEEKD